MWYQLINKIIIYFRKNLLVLKFEFYNHLCMWMTFRKHKTPIKWVYLDKTSVKQVILNDQIILMCKSASININLKLIAFGV